MRRQMTGAHSSWELGEVKVEKDWDKVGEKLEQDAKQVKDLHFSPHYRERIKDYFERVALERKKKREGGQPDLQE